jgi:hypothetical protein
MSTGDIIGGWIDGLAREISRGDPLVIAVAVALLATAAVFSAWQARRHLGNVRLIEDTPTAKARSAHQGYVELQGLGHIMDGPPIIAPLSGLPCVWYRYHIEEEVVFYDKGQSQRRWKTVDRGSSTETFWLEDETGRALVDPEGADVTARHEDVWTARSARAGIAKTTPFIARFFASRSGANRFRFTEQRIVSGEPIYALGLLKNLGSLGGSSTIDAEVRGLLQNWKRNQAELKQHFDLNKDGRIDQREWMLARAQARRDVLKQRREVTQRFNDGINIISRTGDRARPFLLSAFPQSELITRYRIWAGLYFAGFFFLGCTALWVFNERFG